MVSARTDAEIESDALEQVCAVMRLNLVHRAVPPETIDEVLAEVSASLAGDVIEVHIPLAYRVLCSRPVVRFDPRKPPV